MPQSAQLEQIALLTPEAWAGGGFLADTGGTDQCLKVVGKLTQVRRQ